MQELGHLERPVAWEFLEIFPEPRNVVPQWYRDLLDNARVYISAGGALCISPKPRKGWGWVARSVITEALQNEAETEGLDQVEEPLSEEPLSEESMEIDGSDAT